MVCEIVRGCGATPKLFPCRTDKSLEIGTKYIKKIYLGDLAAERVRDLENVYKMLQEKGVPNVDRLAHSINTTVYLEPKGVDVRPRNENELLQAITCILQALTVSISSKSPHVDVNVYYRCSMKHLPYSTGIFVGLTLSGRLITILSVSHRLGRCFSARHQGINVFISRDSLPSSFCRQPWK
jgi:hypothetical protein